MTKPDKTRAFIIEKTAPLFNTKGYSATSLNDITAATGLTKGSIYGNFENKDAVAVAVFDHQVKALVEKKMLLVNSGQTATDKLLNMLQFYRDNWKNICKTGGCPILNAAIESDDHLPFLKKKVQSSIKSWATVIIDTINEGIARKEFNRTIEPSGYAYSFIAMIEGGIMVSKLLNDQQQLVTMLDRISTIINKELKNKL